MQRGMPRFEMYVEGERKDFGYLVGNLVGKNENVWNVNCRWLRR